MKINGHANEFAIIIVILASALFLGAALYFEVIP